MTSSDLYSRIKKGTQFLRLHFDLGRSEEQGVSTLPLSTPGDSQSVMPRILIADDESTSLCLLEKYLERWDYDFISVSNDSDVLELTNSSDPLRLPF